MKTLKLKITASVLFICCSFCAFAQSDWNFAFYMIEGDPKSISTNYHATNFNIKSDSTFIFGLSEAQESGTIAKDSSLTIRLYDYNSDSENVKWSESFKIVYISDGIFILLSENANLNWFDPKKEGSANIYMFYSKSGIYYNVRKAKRMFRKYRKNI